MILPVNVGGVMTVFQCLIFCSVVLVQVQLDWPAQCTDCIHCTSPHLTSNTSGKYWTKTFSSPGLDLLLLAEMRKNKLEYIITVLS